MSPPHRLSEALAVLDLTGSVTDVGLVIAIGTEATPLLAAGWLGGSTIVLASLPSVRAVRGG